MADLSGFATKDSAEDGVILPVKIDGLKFPIAIKVYGSDSDAVKLYERKIMRKMNIGKKGKTDIDEDALDEILDSNEGALVRIGGMWSYDWKKKRVDESDPVVLDGETLGCNQESYELLLEKLPAIKDWVIEQSNNRDNFLLLGKKN